MKWKGENSSSSLVGVSSVSPVATNPPHPTFTMGRLGDTTLNSPNSEEVCRNEDGTEYRCAVGHCCTDSSCCTYYYELWWFWLIWTLIILMSCCCAYHHRKKRQSLRARRARNGNGNEPYAGTCNYPGPPVDKGMLGYCKLPKYEDIARIPPSGSPPPPYSSRRNLSSIAHLEPDAEGVASMSFLSYNDLTSSVLSLVSSLGFTFGQRDGGTDHSDRRCTQIREHQASLYGNEEEGSNTENIDAHMNIPSYNHVEDVRADVSNECQRFSEEKKPIKIIESLEMMRGLNPLIYHTHNNVKSVVDVDVTNVTNVEDRSDESTREETDNQQNELDMNQEESVCIVDETSKEKFCRKERQRQDSGIGAEESDTNLYGMDNEYSCTESDQQNGANEKHYTKMLPLKHQNHVKQYEKVRVRFSNPLKLGLRYNSSYDDDDSSEDDDDDPINYTLDLNNNGSSTSHSMSGCYSNSPCAHDGTHSAGDFYLQQNSENLAESHGDFILELSPIESETCDEPSHPKER